MELCLVEVTKSGNSLLKGTKSGFNQEASDVADE